MRFLYQIARRGLWAVQRFQPMATSITEKPYVYLPHTLPSELQALVESYFHIVGDSNLKQNQDKISAIFVHVKPKVSEEIICSFPALKVIGNCAVGYDNIDIKACQKHGLRIGYTPDVLNDSTADMGLALLLAVARRVVEGNERTKNPAITAIDSNWYGYQVSHMTAGIIGMGRIGFEVAKRVHGFDMKLLYHNRTQRTRDVEVQVQATYVPNLYDLLGQSDYVILVAPATKETYHMMGKDEFAAMKKTGIFINISRGSLVNQDALVDALKHNVIRGAGLDVTDPEPLPHDHPLLTFPNVVITPHTGSATMYTRRKMVQLTIDNIIAGLRGDEMPSELKIN